MNLLTGKSLAFSIWINLNIWKSCPHFWSFEALVCQGREFGGWQTELKAISNSLHSDLMWIQFISDLCCEDDAVLWLCMSSPSVVDHHNFTHNTFCPPIFELIWIFQKYRQLKMGKCQVSWTHVCERKTRKMSKYFSQIFPWGENIKCPPPSCRLFKLQFSTK